MTTLRLLSVTLLLCVLFPFASQAKATDMLEQATASSSIQRVRIDFVSPQGYTRHLLLGFTSDNSASDGVDYGYDALNIENFPDDLNWRIGDNNYIIQGVGAFSTSKIYPFRMFLSNDGAIEIGLNALENFATPIDVFIYDAMLNTFTQINDAEFNTSMLSGEYINRFFITFTSDYNQIAPALSTYSLQLSTDNFTSQVPEIHYYTSTQTLSVKAPSSNLYKVELMDLSGKVLYREDLKALKTWNLNLNQLAASAKVLLVKTYSENGSQTKKILCAG